MLKEQEGGRRSQPGLPLATLWVESAPQLARWQIDLQACDDRDIANCRLPFRLRVHCVSQYMTIAAMQTVDLKVWAHRSWQVWMRRQPFSLLNMFSTFWRWRQGMVSYGMCILRFAFNGMQAVMCAGSRQGGTSQRRSPCQREVPWLGRIDHQHSTFAIAHLLFAKQYDQRAAHAVTDGVKLGFQASFGAPDTLG